MLSNTREKTKDLNKTNDILKELEKIYDHYKKNPNGEKLQIKFKKIINNYLGTDLGKQFFDFFTVIKNLTSKNAAKLFIESYINIIRKEYSESIENIINNFSKEQKKEILKCVNKQNCSNKIPGNLYYLLLKNLEVQEIKKYVKAHNFGYKQLAGFFIEAFGNKDSKRNDYLIKFLSDNETNEQCINIFPYLFEKNEWVIGTMYYIEYLSSFGTQANADTMNVFFQNKLVTHLLQAIDKISSEQEFSSLNFKITKEIISEKKIDLKKVKKETIDNLTLYWTIFLDSQNDKNELLCFKVLDSLINYDKKLAYCFFNMIKNEKLKEKFIDYLDPLRRMKLLIDETFPKEVISQNKLLNTLANDYFETKETLNPPCIIIPNFLSKKTALIDKNKIYIHSNNENKLSYTYFENKESFINEQPITHTIERNEIDFYDELNTYFYDQVNKYDQQENLEINQWDIELREFFIKKGIIKTSITEELIQKIYLNVNKNTINKNLINQTLAKLINKLRPIYGLEESYIFLRKKLTEKISKKFEKKEDLWSWLIKNHEKIETHYTLENAILAKVETITTTGNTYATTKFNDFASIFWVNRYGLNNDTTSLLIDAITTLHYFDKTLKIKLLTHPNISINNLTDIFISFYNEEKYKNFALELFKGLPKDTQSKIFSSICSKENKIDVIAFLIDLKNIAISAKENKDIALQELTNLYSQFTNEVKKSLNQLISVNFSNINETATVDKQKYFIHDILDLFYILPPSEQVMIFNELKDKIKTLTHIFEHPNTIIIERKGNGKKDLLKLLWSNNKSLLIECFLNDNDEFKNALKPENITTNHLFLYFISLITNSSEKKDLIIQLTNKSCDWVTIKKLLSIQDSELVKIIINSNKINSELKQKLFHSIPNESFQDKQFSDIAKTLFVELSDDQKIILLIQLINNNDSESVKKLIKKIDEDLFINLLLQIGKTQKDDIQKNIENIFFSNTDLAKEILLAIINYINTIDDEDDKIILDIFIGLFFNQKVEIIRNTLLSINAPVIQNNSKTLTFNLSLFSNSKSSDSESTPFIEKTDFRSSLFYLLNIYKANSEYKINIIANLWKGYTHPNRFKFIIDILFAEIQNQEQIQNQKEYMAKFLTLLTAIAPFYPEIIESIGIDNWQDIIKLITNHENHIENNFQLLLTPLFTTCFKINKEKTLNLLLTLIDQNETDIETKFTEICTLFFSEPQIFAALLYARFNLNKLSYSSIEYLTKPIIAITDQTIFNNLLTCVYKHRQDDKNYTASNELLTKIGNALIQDSTEDFLTVFKLFLDKPKAFVEILDNFKTSGKTSTKEELKAISELIITGTNTKLIFDIILNLMTYQNSNIEYTYGRMLATMSFIALIDTKLDFACEVFDNLDETITNNLLNYCILEYKHAAYSLNSFVKHNIEKTENINLPENFYTFFYKFEKSIDLQVFILQTWINKQLNLINDRKKNANKVHQYLLTLVNILKIKDPTKIKEITENWLEADEKEARQYWLRAIPSNVEISNPRASSQSFMSMSD